MVPLVFQHSLFDQSAIFTGQIDWALQRLLHYLLHIVPGAQCETAVSISVVHNHWQLLRLVYLPPKCVGRSKILAQ